MGLFTTTKGSIISEYFMILDRLAHIPAEVMVDVALYEDHLVLKGLGIKPPITLKYSQITDVIYGTETQNVEAQKSTIGRALAVGLLFGGTGAIVGAISGTGTKQKKITKVYFCISLVTQAGEDKVLRFEDTRRDEGKQLARKLRELCGLPEETSPVITSL